MTRRVLLLVLASICLLANVASADDVQRLYVLDCGRNIGRDQARWSPGVNEGQSIEFSNNCYHHDKAQSEGLRYAPAYYE
jgi:hypothetical protein